MLNLKRIFEKPILKNTFAGFALLGSSLVFVDRGREYLNDQTPEPTPISYSEFVRGAQTGDLSDVIVTRSGIIGRTKEGKEFTTAAPPEENIIKRLEGSGAEIWGADPNAPKSPLDPLLLLSLALAAAVSAQAFQARKELLAHRHEQKEEADRQNLPYYETALRETAYHEAGHLLIALLYPERFDVKNAKIIENATSFGSVSARLHSNSFSPSQTDLEHFIMYDLAGLAAEEIVFGKGNTGTGVRGDLSRVTNTANSMVTHFGMSALGPMYIDDTVFRSDNYKIPVLGTVFTKSYWVPNPALTPEMQNRINAEVEKVLKDLKERTVEILQKHRPQLDALAEGLLEHKTLSGEQARMIFKASLAAHPPFLALPAPAAEMS